jgi:hypothetical protein
MFFWRPHSLYNSKQHNTQTRGGILRFIVIVTPMGSDLLVSFEVSNHMVYCLGLM